MVDDDHCAALPDRFEKLHRLRSFARAHAGERLVEQEQARRSGEGKPDLQAALLAIGELRYRQVGAIAETHLCERPLDSLRQVIDLVDPLQEIEPERASLLR